MRTTPEKSSRYAERGETLQRAYEDVDSRVQRTVKSELRARESGAKLHGESRQLKAAIMEYNGGNKRIWNQIVGGVLPA